jgi:hypothetical protein
VRSLPTGTTRKDLGRHGHVGQVSNFPQVLASRGSLSSPTLTRKHGSNLEER